MHMITVLLDLNENECATKTWRPAVFHCPNPISRKDSWAVAWGKCCAMLSNGIRPLGWSTEGDNTDEDGVEWFDFEEDALGYLQEVQS
jgi:hypothetical protein